MLSGTITFAGVVVDNILYLPIPTYTWDQVQTFWDVCDDMRKRGLSEKLYVVMGEDVHTVIDERVTCSCGVKAEWGDYLCGVCRGQ